MLLVFLHHVAERLQQPSGLLQDGEQLLRAVRVVKEVEVEGGHGTSAKDVDVLLRAPENRGENLDEQVYDCRDERSVTMAFLA